MRKSDLLWDGRSCWSAIPDDALAIPLTRAWLTVRSRERVGEQIGISRKERVTVSGEGRNKTRRGGGGEKEEEEEGRRRRRRKEIEGREENRFCRGGSHLRTPSSFCCSQSWSAGRMLPGQASPVPSKHSH
eukprot:748119-Hanusia_phi.AAC.1